MAPAPRSIQGSQRRSLCAPARNQLKATADSEHYYKDGQEREVLLESLDNASLFGGVSESYADAEILIGTNNSVTTRTQIVAHDLTISSEAEVEAEIRASSGLFAVGIALAEPNAKVSTGNVSLLVANE